MYLWEARSSYSDCYSDIGLSPAISHFQSLSVASCVEAINIHDGSLNSPKLIQYGILFRLVADGHLCSNQWVVSSNHTVYNKWISMCSHKPLPHCSCFPPWPLRPIFRQIFPMTIKSLCFMIMIVSWTLDFSMRYCMVGTDVQCLGM